METKKIKRKEIEKVMLLMDTIDLSMVKMKLMEVDDGEAWTKAYCDDIEVLYKEFLCMVYLYPGKAIVPTREIDIFWHNHILDTKAYAADCQTIFKKFINHYPYSGMKGKADAKRQKENYEESKKIYHHLFDKSYVGVAKKCIRCNILGG